MFMANIRFPKLNPHAAEALSRPNKKHRREKLIEVVEAFIVIG